MATYVFDPNTGAVIGYTPDRDESGDITSGNPFQPGFGAPVDPFPINNPDPYDYSPEVEYDLRNDWGGDLHITGPYSYGTGGNQGSFYQSQLNLIRQSHNRSIELLNRLNYNNIQRMEYTRRQAEYLTSLLISDLELRRQQSEITRFQQQELSIREFEAAANELARDVDMAFLMEAYFRLKYSEEEMTRVVEYMKFGRKIEPNEPGFEELLETLLHAMAALFLPLFDALTPENAGQAITPIPGRSGYQPGRLPPAHDRAPWHQRKYDKYPRPQLERSQFRPQKFQANNMSWGKISNQKIPAVIGLLAANTWSPQEGVYFDGKTFPEFRADQIARLDAEKQLVPVTVKSSRWQVKSKGWADKTTSTERWTVKPSPRLEPETYLRYKLTKELGPYPNTVPVPASGLAVIREPNIPYSDPIPDTVWSVEFNLGQMVIQRKEIAPRKDQAHVRRSRREKKNDSQRAYLGALLMAKAAFDTPQTLLDMVDAVQNNTLVNVGGFWYILGKLPAERRFSDVVQQRLEEGHFVVNWEDVAADILLNEIIDISVARMKQNERHMIRNSKFWQNSFGNPSTWLGRIF